MTWGMNFSKLKVRHLVDPQRSRPTRRKGKDEEFRFNGAFFIHSTGTGSSSSSSSGCGCACCEGQRYSIIIQIGAPNSTPTGIKANNGSQDESSSLLLLDGALMGDSIVVLLGSSEVHMPSRQVQSSDG